MEEKIEVLAKLVKKYVGLNPFRLRSWMRKDFEGLGTPNSLIESGKIDSLISRLREIINGR